MLTCFLCVCECVCLFSVGWRGWGKDVDDGQVVGWLIKVSDDLRLNRKTVMKERRLVEANPHPVHHHHRRHLHRHPHRPHLHRRRPPDLQNGTNKLISNWFHQIVFHRNGEFDDNFTSSSKSPTSSVGWWTNDRHWRRSACNCCWWPSSGTPVSHGWSRHSAAVARWLGSNANMGCRNSAKSRACWISHSYFSVSTSKRPHGLSLVMCRNSPVEKSTTNKFTSSNGRDVSIRLTLFIEEDPRVFPWSSDVFWNITQKFDDVSQVVLVPWIILTRVRLEQIVTCR